MGCGRCQSSSQGCLKRGQSKSWPQFKFEVWQTLAFSKASSTIPRLAKSHKHTAAPAANHHQHHPPQSVRVANERGLLMAVGACWEVCYVPHLEDTMCSIWPWHSLSFCGHIHNRAGFLTDYRSERLGDVTGCPHVILQVLSTSHFGPMPC